MISRYTQTKDPRTGLYIKIDRKTGQIVSHKRTAGPYKGIPVARKAAGKETWASFLKKRMGPAMRSHMKAGRSGKQAHTLAMREIGRQWRSR